MESNGTQISIELVIAFICLFAFGVIYNVIVERFQQRTQRFTAEMVVGGVLVTVTASGFFIGWINAGIVLFLFVGSGLPMIIGSWLRAAKDDEEAKKVYKESIQ
jgi:hypothetical protein